MKTHLPGYIRWHILSSTPRKSHNSIQLQNLMQQWVVVETSIAWLGSCPLHAPGVDAVV